MSKSCDKCDEKNKKIKSLQAQVRKLTRERDAAVARIHVPHVAREPHPDTMAGGGSARRR